MRIMQSMAIAGGAVIGLVAATGVADSAETGDTSIVGAQLEEIVVTAQKRSQNADDVPVSIAVLSGEQLLQHGVTRVEDLAKEVPGLSYTETQYDAPVYTLRGVGYNESSLAASPTVSVYVDEVPLPYPAMTRGGTLDLDRVEVLKGPQGTLFGQNSTGGAINFVAAKPTNSFSAGTTLSYGNFNSVDAQGFVSGPLGNAVTARLAGSVVKTGDWQQSTTRADTTGSTDLITGRLLLDFAPTNDVKFVVNLNGWRDRSDTQASQFAGIALAVQGGIPLPGAIANAPFATNDRAADWTPGIAFKRDNSFYQASLRGDWAATAHIKVTSITAYEHFARQSLNDASGTPALDLNLGLGGHISAFTQELRIAGDADRLNWIVGTNYQNDTIQDLQSVSLQDSPGSYVGPFQFLGVNNEGTTHNRTWAIFGNAERELTDRFSVFAGARYSEAKEDFSGCSLDRGQGDLSGIFDFIQGVVLNVPVTAQPGGCVTLLPDNSTGTFVDQQKEGNVAWRAGLNFKPQPGMLVYASVSKGYKAGGFPTLSASSYTQFKPVAQEELLAYEVGFKAPLIEHTVRLNGALFYYDYSNKQFLGRNADPFFGELSVLLNVPKSSVKGGEAQLQWLPVRGLNIAAAVTYLDTRIGRDSNGMGFVNYNEFGGLEDFSGKRFPYTPMWQGNVGIDYGWTLTSSFGAFAGGGLTSMSATKGGLEDDPRLAINAYVLTDLRAGINSNDDRWRVAVYGRNITSKYYWNNVMHVQDTVIRCAGMPAQYGVTVAYHW